MAERPQCLAAEEGRGRDRPLRFRKLVESGNSTLEETGRRRRDRLVGLDEQFTQFDVASSVSQDRLLAKPGQIGHREPPLR
jgi:hypothetical protein